MSENSKPPLEFSKAYEQSVFEAAFQNHDFHVVFQPVVDLSNGEIFSYESLLRSSHKAFKTPPEMLQAAVEAGKIGPFARTLREESVASCPNTNLFLNIHPAELGGGWLVRPDDPIFQHEEEIYLEITESVPLSHFELCESILKEVRSKGVYLAVDDLGAGYSNIKYIADLSPEIVKLDRELIKDLHKSKPQQTLVTSLVRLCRDMGASVVAEGIETRDELKAVRDTGARYGQGYLLARPAFPLPTVAWPPTKDA